MTCSICFDSITQNKFNIYITTCKHTYCRLCWYSWENTCWKHKQKLQFVMCRRQQKYSYYHYLKKLFNTIYLLVVLSSNMLLIVLDDFIENVYE